MAIAAVAATALEHARQVESLEEREPPAPGRSSISITTWSATAAMRDVYRRIARVAPTDSTVLITGESGTGKELVARAIHRNSPRADKPFVAINCAAHHRDAARERAVRPREGRVHRRHRRRRKGSSRPPTAARCSSTRSASCRSRLQAKLLRVLQEREFERVGGTRPVHVDVRLIAATNRDLEAAIAARRRSGAISTTA